MDTEKSLDNFKLNFKIWLSTPNGKGVMGDGKWQILKAIEKHGSLRAATKALGLTYRRTWGDLKAIEEVFGFPLLDKSRGGADGGKTELTQEGKNLVNAFDAFHSKVDVMMDEAFREFRQNLVDK
jgi:molybdate transport system regulatory protein